MCVNHPHWSESALPVCNQKFQWRQQKQLKWCLQQRWMSSQTTQVSPNGSPTPCSLGLDMTISNVIVSQWPFKDLELIKEKNTPAALNGRKSHLWSEHWMELSSELKWFWDGSKAMFTVKGLCHEIRRVCVFVITLRSRGTVSVSNIVWCKMMFFVF